MAPGLLKMFQIWSWPGVTGIRWLPWLCLCMEKSAGPQAGRLAGAGQCGPTHPEGRDVGLLWPAQAWSAQNAIATVVCR